MVRPSMPGVVVTIMPRRPPFPAMSFHRDKRTRTHGLRWSPFISSPRTFVLFTRGLSRIIVGPRGDGGKRNPAVRVQRPPIFPRTAKRPRAAAKCGKSLTERGFCPKVTLEITSMRTSTARRCGQAFLPHYEIGRASLGKECRSRWSPYH